MRERRDRLVAAISEPFDGLSRRAWAVRPDDIDDYLDPMDIADTGTATPPDDDSVDHVVMVVHGIRDDGFWTKRVAREIKSLGRTRNLRVRTPTPTYGYFSMWDFVRPGGRERAAYWFLERYADVKTRFPAAKVSFVGHSNGTYIAARALELTPAVRFENIVFAGSVVRRDFCWTRFVGRVERVLNYVGRGDGVVAFLPAVFEFFRLSWLDIGGAGAFGFSEAARDRDDAKVRPTKSPSASPASVRLHELRFVKGGHGAAIKEEYWSEIARFALLGDEPGRQRQVRPGPTRWLFRVAPAITLGGVLIALGIFLLPLAVPVYLLHHPGLSMFRLIAWVALSVFAAWVAGRFVKQW